jgi:hypothetical protein
MRRADNLAFRLWSSAFLLAALIMTIAAIRYDRLVNHQYEHAEAMRLEAQQREQERVARFEKAADKMCDGGWYRLNEYTIQCALHNGQRLPIVKQVRL